MQNVITVATMRDSDAHTIAEYTPSRELMHRAALGVYQAADWTGKTVAILTGGGNNGGDGYALAAILAGKGIPCQLYRVSEKFSADGTFYYSVDINSGMNGDTGKGGPVVKSDLTVTIGYLKAGMLLGDAVWSIGKLVVADIGIRLIRDDYFLAKPEEAVFPHSDLSLDGDHVTLLTPGEAEDLSKAGQTIPDVAQELALRSRRLVRVLGRYALATDGYRTYFLEQCHQLNGSQFLFILFEYFIDLCFFMRSVDRFGRTGTTAFVRRIVICAYNRSRLSLEEVESIATTVRFVSEMVIAKFIL